MIYDVTPRIDERLQVWPGDTPPSREVLLDMRKGDNLTLSTLRGTVHLGAHVDGPNHYGRWAPAVDELPIDLFLGPCQVVRAKADRGRRIQRGDLPAEIDTERLLIHSGTYPDSAQLNQDFAGLSPQLVDTLHDEGVRLVGVDTPSVDVFDSKELIAHQRFLANEMAILEGLRLGHVPTGVYELIALPLRLVGFDASPVRAVLRTIPA